MDAAVKERRRAVRDGLVGVAALVASFLVWWVVSILLDPGSIPVQGIAVVIAQATVVAVVAMVVVVLVTGRLSLMFTGIVPAVGLVFLVSYMVVMSGAGAGSIAAFTVFYAAPFLLWAVVWFLSIRALQRRDEARPDPR